MGNGMRDVRTGVNFVFLPSLPYTFILINTLCFFSTIVMLQHELAPSLLYHRVVEHAIITSPLVPIHASKKAY